VYGNLASPSRHLRHRSTGGPHRRWGSVVVGSRCCGACWPR